MKLEIETIERHRNGDLGSPFYAVIFKIEGNRMLGILFEQAAHIAVFSLDKITYGNISFVENGWPGDQYEAALRSSIDLVEEMEGL